MPTTFMSRKHNDDICKFCHDVFGFDGTIEESSREIVKMFENLGIPLYFDSKVTGQPAASIPCETELSKEEVLSLISSIILKD